MCTYNGVIEEYPWISIDCFEKLNIQRSTTFIITHIHTDHLRGLETEEFYLFLRNQQLSVYCSDVSKQFLSRLPQYAHLNRHLKEIQTQQPFIIQKKKNTGEGDVDTCLCTFVGSGHCPGSVMVLLEGSNGNVLFTGDFRLYLKQCQRFLNKWSPQKQISKLYVDMTFFHPNIRYIPTRETACEALMRFLAQQIGLDSIHRNQIYLKTSARVGYEYIYEQIYQRFKQKIHVEHHQYELYDCLPNVQQCLTTDPTETCLHACRSSNQFLSCPCISYRQSPYGRIKIILSIMWFTQVMNVQELLIRYRKQTDFSYMKDNNDELDDDWTNKTYRLCYSLHSSYSEIVTFLRRIQPLHIHPIAYPSHISLKRIHQICSKILPETNIIKSQLPPVTHTTLQIKKRRYYEEMTNSADNELDLLGDYEREQSVLLGHVSSMNEKQIKKKLKSQTSQLFKPLDSNIDDHHSMEQSINSDNDLFSKIQRQTSYNQDENDENSCIILSSDGEDDSLGV
ncbi:unnamed protein product [Didymodactylos carnosus]|uniref:Protein artemis n=1 Tax=Didymodactylos carnosus TaxID=1234261 RepID=A0A814KTE3_9BILA|nr:unnamed protein product [Didymodactylos carnosus]CAF1114476.1 unnamed protein product [Didymodactylos carnosus]CAF3824645.1 unnamed protein product [Didymodactylos carnosus]CAF3883944.1 unnamed protein product [Didymodactylos carnosus]